MLFGACWEPSKSVRQEAVGKGTPQSGAVAGVSGFTDAQLEAIGGLVEGLLEKALCSLRLGVSPRLEVRADHHEAAATETAVSRY